MHFELTASDWIAILCAAIGTVIGAVISLILTKIAIDSTRKDIENAVHDAVDRLNKTIPGSAAKAVRQGNLVDAILAAVPAIVGVTEHFSDKGTPKPPPAAAPAAPPKTPPKP